MRLKQTFKQLQNAKQTALIPYIAAGDPNLETSLKLMHALVKAGADIIELGVPFSDPVADGPVIQAAHERALQQHVTIHDVLQLVKEFRTQDQATPVVLMSYANPIAILGYEKFATKAKEADVDGVLVVDLPLEEGQILFSHLKQVAIDPILLLAPTTSQDRAKKIAQAAQGYLYYVSLKGITGAGSLNIEEVKTKLTELRKLSSIPLVVGFGIHDAASAKALAELGDGIVVGSAIIERIARNLGTPQQMLDEVSGLVQELKNVGFKMECGRHPSESWGPNGGG